jgi:hypothetical protein
MALVYSGYYTEGWMITDAFWLWSTGYSKILTKTIGYLKRNLYYYYDYYYYLTSLMQDAAGLVLS